MSACLAGNDTSPLLGRCILSGSVGGSTTAQVMNSVDGV